MELRIAFLFFLLIVFAVWLLGFALRPVFTRLWRYWRAIKAQDEEQRREEAQSRALREKALEELQGGLRLPAEEPTKLNNQQ